MNKVDIFFDLNHCCNYKCIFCRNSKLAREFINLENIKNFTDLLAHARSVDITGYGEITIHPQFVDYLKLFSSKKIPIRFVTNGSNLTSETIRHIMDSTASEIIISLNSMNPNIYSKLTGGMGNVYKVMKGIDELVEKNKARLNKIKIVLSFVMTSYNLVEVPDFIDYAKRLNVPLSLLDLTPTIKDYEEGLMIEDNPHNRNFLIEMKKKAEIEGVDLAVFNFDNRKTLDSKLDEKKLKEVVKRCDWLQRYTFIGTDGEVGICCWSDYKLGNIKENSINEIRRSPKFKHILNCIRLGDTTYCKNCRREG